MTSTLVMFVLITVAVWLPFVHYAIKGGFRKPEPLYQAPCHATLLARPGVTLDLVSMDGTVHAKVVLVNLTRDYQRGTSANFVDYFQYVQERTVKF